MKKNKKKSLKGKFFFLLPAEEKNEHPKEDKRDLEKIVKKGENLAILKANLVQTTDDTKFFSWLPLFVSSSLMREKDMLGNA